MDAARLVAILLIACWQGAAPAATPAVSAGDKHGMALHADGTVRTWGDDSQGQLGLGRTLAAPAPAAVIGINDVRRVASGERHVAALRRDGTVWAWGRNTGGELGDGSTASRSTPGPVPGLSGVTQVSAMGGFTLALKSDGTVWSWGDNDERVPQQVPGLAGIQAVAAGGSHALALDADGAVWSWGRNGSGQLGDGTRTDRATPQRIGGLPPARSVIVGFSHSLVITRGGIVFSWGSNYGGQVGNGSPLDQLVPVEITGLAGVDRIVGGDFHTLALMSDGTLRAWGDNNEGQLGYGGRGGADTPRAVPGLAGVTDIAAGLFFSVARTSDGAVWAWGDNASSQIADGTRARRETPHRIPSLPTVESIAAGGHHAFAVLGDGRVFAWGSNEFGELGDGIRPLRTTPGIVSGASGIIRIAGGGDHSLALRADGTVLAWGSDTYGQLGEESRQARSSPAPVAGIAGVREISAGYYFSVALTDDGSAWTWGYNYGGQLGQGSSEYSVNATPTRLTGQPPLTKISSGGSHTLALTATGTIVAWGGNGSGQLGDGARVDRYAPVAVPGLTNVAAVAAGNSHSLALGGDGYVYAWGYNRWGQLGDGTRDDRSNPAIVAGLSGVVAIGAGGVSSYAVLADGSVHAWGGDLARPVVIPQLRGIRAISGGGGGRLVLKSDGTVYAWGENLDGRVGDGTLVSREAPVLVVREDGAGTLEGNNWFLDLDPSIPKSVPANFVPAFLVVTRRAAEVTAQLQFRGADVGSTGSVFTFALAPATLVRGAALAKDARMGWKATGGAKADPPVACALAQLNAQGQLVAVSAASLQAYASGVLSAQGQSVNILNATNPNVAGATFYVGYGANGNAMLVDGKTRSVVSVPGTVSCRPQSPQTGWWWNPAEGGRGFTIEARGNALFMAAFHYDDAGQAMWNYAGGATSLDGAMFTSSFLRASGGQTLTGTYPGSPASVGIGPVTMLFSDATHGTLIWPGGTTPIERLPFVPNGLTTPVPANVPEAGWWWNPQESGRGFFIEWQNNNAHIAGYMYDAAGNPVWYLSRDPWTDPLRYVGPWQRFGNGQAPGAPHRPAQLLDPNVGALTIEFSSATRGTLTLPDGRRTPIERQVF